jgi:Spy/CpxP family protein refolding chaperone
MGGAFDLGSAERRASEYFEHALGHLSYGAIGFVAQQFARFIGHNLGETMRIRTYITVLLVATGTTVRAQPSPQKELPTAADVGQKPRLPASMEPGKDGLFEKNFFPPELIMLHQDAIGLTPEQQTAIRAEMQKMVAQLTDLQWQGSAETEALATLISKERPDEKEVLTQLDKLLNIENQIKRLHTGLLIRIKNTLTAEQQAKLRELTGNTGPRPRAPAGSSNR